MLIRPALNYDLQELQRIFAAAKSFMRSTGNLEQWNGPYPSDELLLSEISAGHCFMVESEGKPVATFCLILGADPTYSYIEGEWPSDAPYGTIHRIASDGSVRGIGEFVFNHCFSIIDTIRIDTHEDNLPMQNLVTKYGFKRCGIIYIADGSPRIAYQKSI